MKSLLKQDIKENKKTSGKKSSLRIKDIALIGMMSAALITAQVALSFLPNVELVTALIIIFTLIFGRKTLYIIYLFVFAEGFIYGFGMWWINYLYVWAFLYFVVRLLRKCHSLFLWVAVSSIFGFSFGALCSIPYFFMGSLPSVAAYWIAGIPYDLIHGFSNLGIALVIFIPVYISMRINHKKYIQ
jgi:energy-coupling factor transport system substrate-specific component